jgi:predicted kinase
MSDEGDNLAEDVSRVLAALDLRSSPQPRPVLVVLIGLPGTGKSHVATKLQRRTGFAVLESDAARKALFPRPRYTSLESRRLFAAIHAAIDHLLAEGTSCIFDATNLLEQYCQPLRHR